jgi:hypothetical protein
MVVVSEYQKSTFNNFAISDSHRFVGFAANHARQREAIKAVAILNSGQGTAAASVSRASALKNKWK